MTVHRIGDRYMVINANRLMASRIGELAGWHKAQMILDFGSGIPDGGATHLYGEEEVERIREAA